LQDDCTLAPEMVCFWPILALSVQLHDILVEVAGVEPASHEPI